MAKFFQSLAYHARSAWNNILRNFGNAISSIFAVTITLILVMLFAVIAINVNGFTMNVEDNVQIFARIDSMVDETQYEQVQAQIESLPNVTNVVFSSAEEQYEKVFPNGQSTSVSQANPLPAAFYIDASEGKYVSELAKSINEMDGIMDASFGGDAIVAMINAFVSMRFYGGIFIVALCLLAVFLISNTIKINIYNRREEIGIMRNVGASNGFIKIPFLIEGMLIGTFGSIIPILLAIFGYGFVFDSLHGNFFTPMFKLQPPIPFVLEISALLLVVGIVVGVVGSFLSINKYLKFKR